jgi:NADPH:quinone reductase-like Zn-dependent oxidoreductase
MRQIWITKAGPPEVLEVKDAPDPEPKAGEVRIRVEASGVRPRIARSFRFDEAPQAHHFIQDRQNIGKVMLVPEVGAGKA